MRHPQPFLLFLRSLLFFILSLPWMMFYSFVLFLTWVIPLSWRAYAIRFYLRSVLYMLRFICGIKWQVHGIRNIPKHRNGVVLSKHQSTWETYFLPIIFKNPAIILKRELLFVPFFGWGVAPSLPIAINRGKRSRAMHQIITQGGKRLKAGRWILVFPEGTRIPHGHTGHYRLGGARLAVTTGYPVIPVAHNAGRFWPRRGFLKYPGTVHVHFGPLIETVNRTPEEVLAIAKKWIEDTCAAIDAAHPYAGELASRQESHR